MKRLTRLTSFVLLIFVLSMGMMWSQEKKKETPKKAQKKEAQKKEAEKKPSPLLMVEKVKPVPHDVKAGFDSIDDNDALAYLKFLSSDPLEGRETASTGYHAAAQFSATLFEAWGLKPGGDKPGPGGSPWRRLMGGKEPAIKPTRSFLQQVELKENLDSSGSARVEWRKSGQFKALGFEQNVDYQYRSRGGGEFSAPVVFVGYGIQEKSLKFDEYKGIDVKGKIVMMLSETPRKGVKDSPFEKKEFKKKYYPSGRGWRRSSSSKSKIAMKQGAIAVLVVENSPQEKPTVAKRVLSSQKIDDTRPIYPGKRRSFSLAQGSSRWPGQTIPSIRISTQMADKILELNGLKLDALKNKIEKTMKPASTALPGTSFLIKTKVSSRLAKCYNVVGYVEGSDEKLKDEIVVIGAHLDHLGKRGDYIFNGADDNGSGSVSVLEVAQAFAVNPVKPKRSVVFALWTGEEKGLLGSRYFVANSPFPGKKVSAYINLDMVSRSYDKKRLQRMLKMMGGGLSKEDMKKVDAENVVRFAYGAKYPALLEALKAQNQFVGLHVITRETKGQRVGGSDHAAFAMKGLPWAGFMAAMTEDYHQASDSYEKINWPMLQKTIRLTFLTAMAVANK